MLGSWDYRLTTCNAAWRSVRASSASRIEQVLNEKQMQRIGEINLQVVGFLALNYDDVAKKLGLSAEQKQQLKNLSDEAHRRADGALLPQFEFNSSATSNVRISRRNTTKSSRNVRTNR